MFAIPPVISKLRATAVHRRLRLTLTLLAASSARLTVTVSRRQSGRLMRKARLRLTARHGRNSFKPRVPPLAPGRYLVAVTAVTPGGGHSRRYTATLVVSGR